jgi:hypothetical protein
MSDNGLNLSFISDYSNQFCNKIYANLFKDKESIDGPALLKVTNIEQVDYFILKNLFRSWQKEWYKLRSPYFDYNNAEVQTALKQFMNTLSNHIKVGKQDFRPLLINAVQNALILAYSPYDYFRKEVDSMDDIIEVNEFKSIEKYVKINKGLYKAFLNKLYLESQTTVTKTKAFQILDYIFESIEEGPEDPTHLAAQLDDVHVFDSNTIYGQVSVDEKPDKKVKKADSKKKKTFAGESAVTQTNSIQRIDSIRKNISINQRYMFVNELFGKDNDLFNTTLEELDSKSVKDDALTYLKERITDRFKWDEESEVVQEFMEILDRRYP